MTHFFLGLSGRAHFFCPFSRLISRSITSKTNSRIFFPCLIARDLNSRKIAISSCAPKSILSRSTFSTFCSFFMHPYITQIRPCLQGTHKCCIIAYYTETQ